MAFDKIHKTNWNWRSIFDQVDETDIIMANSSSEHFNTLWECAIQFGEIFDNAIILPQRSRSIQITNLHTWRKNNYDYCKHRGWNANISNMKRFWNGSVECVIQKCICLNTTEKCKKGTGANAFVSITSYEEWSERKKKCERTNAVQMVKSAEMERVTSIACIGNACAYLGSLALETLLSRILRSVRVP